MSLPFTYVGLPMFKGRPSKIVFQASFDAIKAKMEGWKGITLSIVGRL